jgi:hypothetical protein
LQLIVRIISERFPKNPSLPQAQLVEATSRFKARAASRSEAPSASAIAAVYQYFFAVQFDKASILKATAEP